MQTSRSSLGRPLVAIAVAIVAAVALPPWAAPALAAGEVVVGDITVTERDVPFDAQVPISWSLPFGSIARVDITVTPNAPANAQDIFPLTQSRNVSGTGKGVINVRIFGDRDREASQTAAVSITFDGLEDGSDTAVLTVLDDDHPTVTIADFQGPEDIGVVHELRLSKAISQDTRLRVRSFNGTAVGGVHFTAVNRFITVAGGATQAFVNVATTADLVIELVSTRTYGLVVTAVNAGDIAVGGDLTASGTIVDDDQGTNNPPNAIIQLAGAPIPPANSIQSGCPDPNLAVGEPFVFPQDVQFRLVLDGISNRPFEVAVFTLEGTADAGQDYQDLNTVIVVPAGIRTATFTVRLFDDGENEGDEFFEVRGTGPMIANSQTCLQNLTEAESTVKIGANIF